MNNLRWFKHDNCAACNNKMAQLISREGAKGYGTYWYLVEKICMQDENSMSFDNLSIIECKGFSRAYMKKVITDFGLFVVEGDSFYPIINYGFADAKRTSKAPNVDEHSAKSQPAVDEHSSTAELMQRKEENAKMADNQLETDEKSEEISRARVRVRQDKIRQEEKRLNKITTTSEKGKKKKLEIQSWKNLVEQLDVATEWGEQVCRRCGYGILLKRHFKEAVDRFRSHILAYDRGSQVQDLSEMRRYFSNYTAAGGRTSKELYNYLLTVDVKWQDEHPDPYRFEKILGGRRTYMGQPIPDNAPPRPDEYSILNEQTMQWFSYRKCSTNGA